MRLPDWPPQDWRAWVALIFGILGGAAFTVFAIWVVYILSFADVWAVDTQAQRIGYLGSSLILLLIGSIASLLSLGFAINQRKLSIRAPGGAEVVLEGGSSGEVKTLHSQTQAVENIETPKG